MHKQVKKDRYAKGLGAKCWNWVSCNKIWELIWSNNRTERNLVVLAHRGQEKKTTPNYRLHKKCHKKTTTQIQEEREHKTNYKLPSFFVFRGIKEKKAGKDTLTPRKED